MRALALIGIFATAWGAGGCGTTTIISSNRSAPIRVDGEFIGTGQGTITKRGPFGSATVELTLGDGRRHAQTISRSFTGTTLVLGLLTYGICLAACWEYPDVIFIDPELWSRGYGYPGGPPAPSPTTQQAWMTGPGSSAGGAVDPWLEPPPGWQGQTVAPPDAPPPRPVAPSQTPEPAPIPPPAP